jgi:RHS repeat-associated protein
VKTIYVIDGKNPTGHTQVLEEKDAAGGVVKTYTIGRDMIAQAASAAAALFFLYDGHGSTRVLLDNLAAIAKNAQAANLKQLFAYDAYGNFLPLPQYVSHEAQVMGQALTALLYSGEQSDLSGLQFLRARYYNPTNGRFTKVDPFAGIIRDSQSLHKYLYSYSDPVNRRDPSGHLPIPVWIGLGILAIIALYFLYTWLSSSPLVGLGTSALTAQPISAVELQVVIKGVHSLRQLNINDESAVDRLSKLESALKEGRFRVNKTDLGQNHQGMHSRFIPGRTFVDQDAFDPVNITTLAPALVVFAEWQHEINSGEPIWLGDTDPGIQAEFDAVRNAIPAASKTNYIKGLRHPVP